MGSRNRYTGIDESTVKLIRFMAKQLCKQSGFCYADQPDIEQELMFELVRHLQDYDPSKASLRTFATGIVQQKIVNLIETQFAQKRDPRAINGSLNEFVQVEDDGHPEERWTTVDIEEYLQSTGATNRSREERLDLKIDLEMAIGKLPEDLRRLCELFSEKNITEVSRELNIPRSTLYTAVNKIKKLLENAGLKIYL